MFLAAFCLLFDFIFRFFVMRIGLHDVPSFFLSDASFTSFPGLQLCCWPTKKNRVRLFVRGG